MRVSASLAHLPHSGRRAADGVGRGRRAARARALGAVGVLREHVLYIFGGLYACDCVAGSLLLYIATCL
jgi:hypothetical protein